MNKYYLVYFIDEEDTSVSWTGNYAYVTATIRGIFSSYEKAKDAANTWKVEEYYSDSIMISERFYDIDKNFFAMNLNEDGLSVHAIDDKKVNEYDNIFELDKIYHEDDHYHDLIYDKKRTLGFEDY